VSEDVLDFLDPSLDIWSNTAQGGVGQGHLGDSGWALAVVTGLRPTRLSLDEIGRITRLGDRQVRRVVDRLVEQSWARRIKEGRRVFVLVNFEMMAHEDLRQDYLKHSRRSYKAKLHRHEAGALKHLGTVVGRTARDLWRGTKRIKGQDRTESQAEISMLETWEECSGKRGVFRELIEILRRRRKEDDPVNGLHRYEAEHRICMYLTT
jgi:hypothetical protein